MKKIILAIGLILGVFVFSGLSQTPTPAPPTPVVRSPSEEAREEAAKRKANADFIRNANKRPDFNHKEEPGPPGRPEIKGPTAIRPSSEQKLRLSPAPDLLAKYADLLRRSNARLVKLFPDLGCVDPRVVRTDEPCRNFIPYSSFYSFRKGNYADRWLSDVGLKNDLFFTDGLLSNGIIVSLGDIPFESVTTSTDGMQFLTEYEPASLLTEIVAKGRQLDAGLNSKGRAYGWTASALENVTYGLRVVAYRGRISQPAGRGYYYDQLGGDKRIDIVAVFRAVRKDADGTVTLLWRELQRKDSPRINVPKAK
jgi:hypothetical protein